MNISMYFYEQASLEYSKQLYQEALKTAEDALLSAESSNQSDFPDGAYVDMLCLFGEIHSALLNYPESKKQFEKAIKFNPSSCRASMGLGKVLVSMGYPEAALKWFGWVLVNDQENDQAVQAIKKIRDSN